MAASQSEPIASPCVRNCCLTDDDVCVGCFRTMTEICAWAALSEPEKAAVMARCRERRQQHDKKFPPRAW